MKRDPGAADLDTLLEEITDHLANPATTLESTLLDRRRCRQRLLLGPTVLDRGWLCWICAAHTVKPRVTGFAFAVCSKCLRIDAHAAGLFGSQHLLPVLRRARHGVQAPHGDPDGDGPAAELARIHLDDDFPAGWRRVLVRAMAEMLQVEDRFDYPLCRWTRDVGWTWGDCARRYSALIEAHAHELATLDERLTDASWLVSAARVRA
jgi:hypothetical protein